MGHCNAGIVERAVPSVDAARDVDIFGIHEESLVETADSLECLSAEQHETALVIGDICRGIGIAFCQHVAAVASFHYRRWEKSAAEHIEWRRQQALHILLRSVRRDYAGRYLSYAAV